MKTSPTMIPIYEVELSFAELKIYEDFLYVNMKEGITVNPAFNDILLAIAQTHFKDKDFVYITHRINSYSIDPTIYLQTAKISNLKGFIVVNTNKELHTSLKVEKLFFEKPFAVFDTLTEAIDFKTEILLRPNK